MAAGLKEHLLMLARRFQESELRFALVGGMAMGLYGSPRTTIDIDFLLAYESEATRACGLIDGLGDHVAVPETRFPQVTIYRRTFTGTRAGIPIDMLAVTGTWAEEALARRVSAEWSRANVPILSPEDFIALKRLRNSAQDQANIAQLLGETP